MLQCSYFLYLQVTGPTRASAVIWNENVLLSILSTPFISWVGNKDSTSNPQGGQQQQSRVGREGSPIEPGKILTLHHTQPSPGQPSPAKAAKTGCVQAKVTVSCQRIPRASTLPPARELYLCWLCSATFDHTKHRPHVHYPAVINTSIPSIKAACHHSMQKQSLKNRSFKPH